MVLIGAVSLICSTKNKELIGAVPNNVTISELHGRFQILPGAFCPPFAGGSVTLL